MFLTNPFAGAFGLDIGDVAIKLVQLQTRPHFASGPAFSIQDIRSIALPPGYIVNGEIQQPEMVRKKLLILLGKEGPGKPIRVPWVVADLPEPKSFLKAVQIEVAPAELTAEDVRFQAKKHLPFDLDEYYLDWQVMDGAVPAKKSSRVLVGAVPKITSDAYTYLLESVGLSPVAFEVEAFCLSRALIPPDPPAETDTAPARLIADLGATRSSLIVFDRGVPVLSVSSSYSGELLTAALAQGLKLDYTAAENLKISNGLGYDKKYPRYLKIMNEFTAILLSEIKQTVQFYNDHSPDAGPIRQIILSGGAGRLGKLGETIARQLRIATAAGRPWEQFRLRPDQKKFAADGLEFASALGLAIRAAENPLNQ